eukprot:jgi/Hompol1/354/HPOL_003105-RA
MHGHLEVFIWIWENIPEIRIGADDLKMAAHAGHFFIIEYFANRVADDLSVLLLGFSRVSLDNAINYRNLELATFLVQVCLVEADPLMIVRISSTWGIEVAARFREAYQSTAAARLGLGGLVSTAGQPATRVWGKTKSRARTGAYRRDAATQRLEDVILGRGISGSTSSTTDSSTANPFKE